MFTSAVEEIDSTRQFLRRRRDIQGLRALAVLLVLAYHAGVPGFSGGYIGVDIFFVISGFLITSLLIREHDSRQKISLKNFYARRIRRLLPASVVVVIGTLIVSRIWLEPLRLRDLTQDARAAALFATNFVFAARESDYLRSTLPASPLQHYWSLGVEEQFYIFFPVLVILLLKTRRDSKLGLNIGIAAVTVLSLVLCVATTKDSGPASFYLLPYRAWELGAGALLATAQSRVAKLEPKLLALFGWLGAVATIVASLVYDDKTIFPGYAAMLPVFATVAMIATGDNSRFGPNRVLQLEIFQWIGSRSYSLYLWHWPILIVARAAAKAELSVNQIALCMIATFALSELTFRFVEQPIHRVPNFLRDANRSLVFGAALIVVGLGASFITAQNDQTDPKPTVTDETRAGDTGVSTTTTIFQYSDQQLKDLLGRSPGLSLLPPDLEPSLDVLANDEPEIYKLGCHDHDFDLPPVCVFGDLEASTSIALVGDSHAAQWFEPLNRISEQRGWRLQTFTRSGCTMLGISGGTIEKCRKWVANVVAEINRAKFSLVVVSGFTNREDLVDESPDGFINNINEMHAALTTSGQKVLYIADTPGPSLHVPICLSANTQTVQNCNFLRETAFNFETAEILKGVWSSETSRFVDLADWFCTESVCPVVIGNMAVYRDLTHISSVYAFALTNVLRDQLDISLGN